MPGEMATTFQTSILPFFVLDCSPLHLSCGISQGTGFQTYLMNHRTLAQMSFLAGEKREKRVSVGTLIKQ